MAVRGLRASGEAHARAAGVKPGSAGRPTPKPVRMVAGIRGMGDGGQGAEGSVTEKSVGAGAEDCLAWARRCQGERVAGPAHGAR